MKKDRNNLLLIVGILGITFAFSLANGFVNWDDPANFLDHPVINSNKGLFQALVEIFSSTVIGNYNPLSTASFLIDKAIFGFENPWGWHFINVLLHIGVCVFVYRIARKLDIGPDVSLVITLLFGMHPMKVESVAWVTERKDVLFGLLYMAAAYQYLLWKEIKKTKHKYYMVLFFILSLLSKIQAVSLPLALIGFDYLLEGKFTIKSMVKKWYLFFLSLIVGLTGLYFLSQEQSLSITYDSTGPMDNIILAGYSIIVYMYKLVIPFPLTAYYQVPSSLQWFHYSGLLALIGYPLWMWYSYKHKSKWIFFGLYFFIVNIFFVLQWVRAGQGYLADRFTYIAYLGPIIAIVLFGNELISSKWKKMIVGAFLLMFFTITIKQIWTWENGESLWTKAIEVNKNSSRSLISRGNFYARNNNTQKAIEDYTSALKIREVEEARRNRAKLLMTTQGLDQANLLTAQSDLIAINVKKVEDYLNLAAINTMLNQYGEAMRYYEEGSQKFPNEYQFPLNQGRINQALGKLELAESNFKTAIQLNPNDAQAYTEIGRMFRSLQRISDAAEMLNQALKIDSTNCVALIERSAIFVNQNDISSARNDVANAIKAGCNNVDATYRQQFGL